MTETRDDLDRLADETERAAAEHLGRVLDGPPQAGSASGADDASHDPALAESLAVVNLFAALRESEAPADEVSRARLRRELVAAASHEARERRATLRAVGALAASVVLALGIVSLRRPPVDAGLLDAREKAARLAVEAVAERFSDAHEASVSGSVVERLRASRVDSLVSTLSSARIDELRWTDESALSRTDATPRPAGVDPTPRSGGAS